MQQEQYEVHCQPRHGAGAQNRRPGAGRSVSTAGVHQGARASSRSGRYGASRSRQAAGSRPQASPPRPAARVSRSAVRRRRRRRQMMLFGFSVLILAVVFAAIAKNMAAPAAGAENGGTVGSATLPAAASVHTGPPYTVAIDAGHGGTDIGAEGVINEIQLTETTIGYLEDWLTQDENYTAVRTHDENTFSKNTERAAAATSAGASLLLSVHGNSDPYSADSYGFECYPQPPGRTHHEDSLRFAHLIADKFGAAGQRLRGNAGVRYIYYEGDDESGYEKQVVEESDTSVHPEQTFGLLEKAPCPAVLVEQCFVTSEADVAAWGTEDGCRKAARLYYEAICAYFSTEPLPG